MSSGIPQDSAAAAPQQECSIVMRFSTNLKTLVICTALAAAGNAPAATDPLEPQAKARQLFATVGPGFQITLKNKAGKTIKSIKRGTYRITVRDNSTAHNFHLIGRGINKSTTVAFKGKKVWTVKFKKVGRYRFLCDPHSSSMKGSFRIK